MIGRFSKENIGMKDHLENAVELIKVTITKWQEDNVSRLAAAVAYFAILSIPPILVLTVTIAGQLIGTQDARQTIINQSSRVLGQQGQAAIQTIMQAVSQPQGFSLATILSFGVLLFSASGVFVQLQGAMNTIFGVEPDSDGAVSSTLKKRILSFLIVIGLGLLLTAIMLVNSIVALLGQTLASFLPGSSVWIQVLNFAVSFLFLIGLIGLIYKEIPDIDVSWHDVGIGALVTSVLFMIGIVAISTFLRYGDPTSSYGAAGSVIVLLIWIYYSAQILFVGAEFTQAYANQYGNMMSPDKSSVWAT
jgi:membrane protein